MGGSRVRSRWAKGILIVRFAGAGVVSAAEFEEEVLVLEMGKTKAR